MDNQSPESNIPQDSSEKTENVFQFAKKPRIPNWVSWAVLAMMVLVAAGAVWWNWGGNEEVGVKTNLGQFKVCQQNSDCVAVPDGCCGCGGGGKNIAINKKFEEEYSKKIQNECNNTGCISVISNDPSCSGIPVCDENKCDLAIPTDDSNISILCGPEPPAKCAAGMSLTCVNGEWSCKEIKEKAVFYSQEECEQKTSEFCVFQTCDFIPLGKTFEETCGKDFKKGWIPKNPVLDQTPPEKQKIIGKIIFSDIEGGCWSFQGDNGERFLIGGDDKSEEIKIIPNILSKKVEIQGKIEKDIVSYCPVGDGLFKLESYRIIDD